MTTKQKQAALNSVSLQFAKIAKAGTMVRLSRLQGIAQGEIDAMRDEALISFAEHDILCRRLLTEVHDRRRELAGNVIVMPLPRMEVVI